MQAPLPSLGGFCADSADTGADGGGIVRLAMLLQQITLWVWLRKSLCINW